MTNSRLLPQTLRLRRNHHSNMTRIAINGFGRIGRAVTRALLEGPRRGSGLELVAVNDPSPAETSAFLLRHDTLHGSAQFEVSAGQDRLSLAGRDAVYTRNRFLAQEGEFDAWADLGVDLVLECSGVLAERPIARGELARTGMRMLTAYPHAQADRTVVTGVNLDSLQDADLLVSNGSCTTNCFTPAAQILSQAYGIESGFLSIVHAVTNNQVLLDVTHGDIRRARSGLENIIPVATKTPHTVGLILPELAGKLAGVTLRVPTANVALIETTLVLKNPPENAEAVNRLLEAAANRPELREILAVSREPLVSSDYNNDAHSCTVDALLTELTGRQLHLSLWYDNEWGFSHRMIDAACAVAKLGPVPDPA